MSRIRARGRRAIELGAGMGLAGMDFSLLGASVVLTDVGEDVLSLLRRNVDTNLTPSALKLNDVAWAVSAAGAVSVAELDWSRPEQYSAVRGDAPFDFVLAADCVYSEAAVPHFLAVVLAMTGPRTVTVITNEFRSATVHEMFMQQFGQYFTIRRVPVSRMDAQFQHPLIHIYLLKRRRGAAAGVQGEGEGEEEDRLLPVNDAGEGLADSTQAAAVEGDGLKQSETSACAQQRDGQSAGGGAPGIAASCMRDEEGASQEGSAGGEGGMEEALGRLSVAGGGAVREEALLPLAKEAGQAEQFRTRRMGVAMARALRDVCVPVPTQGG